MALVLDASVIAEYLMGSEVGAAAATFMAAEAGDLHVPHLAIVETTSVLRGWVRRGEVASARAVAALTDLVDLPARRWPAEPFVARTWELRANATAYDATYVALAEAIDATLVTADGRLARGVAALATCPIVVLAAD